MKKTIAIINGPNINMLGIREVQFYGHDEWKYIQKNIEDVSKELDVDLLFFQSNSQGDIVDFIQENMFNISGIIINPAGYSSIGYPILDAIMIRNIPFIEVHLSNIFSRGEWHAKSIFAPKSVGQIVGFKGMGYELAVRAMIKHLENIKLE